MPVRKVTQTESNNGIPRKADELLSSLGHQVDSREFQRITQVREIERTRPGSIRSSLRDGVSCKYSIFNDYRTDY